MENLNKSSYVPLQTYQSILVTEHNSDIESLIKYLNERLTIYEENINSSYVNIRNVISKLEEEFPQVDINNFTDFFLICEEYYSLIESSKSSVEKLEELNHYNEKLEIKVDKLKSKKIFLRSANENLNEEIIFKDSVIKKLEDDLSNVTKEYMDLSQKLNKNENNYSEALKELSTPNHNFIAELKNLSDEKANLQRENLNLIKNLEKLENEIRSKYVLRQESEKIILKLEGEKNGYFSKLKISENNLERIRKEYQSLKIGNEDLKKELEKSEKKIDELTMSYSNYSQAKNFNSGQYFEMENMETPLNSILNDEENEDNFENRISRKTFSKLKRNSIKEFLINSDVAEFKIESGSQFNIQSPKGLQGVNKISYNPQINIKNTTEKNVIIKEVDENKNSNKSSFDNNNTLPQDLNDSFDKVEFVSEERGKKNNLELKITASKIVNQMSLNNFHSIRKENDENNPFNEKENISKKLINIENINININQPNSEKHTLHSLNTNRHSKIKSIKKNTDNYQQDMYKEFFMMTYQSLKLNSDNIEPFLYVKLKV
jgi:hypothetical protein